MRFQFLNKEHQAEFQKVRSQMAERYRHNKEYLAVAFLITGDEELYQKMYPYFDTEEGMLDSEKMFEEQDLSSGIRIMAKLTVHLFNNKETIAPLDFMKLDDERFGLVMNTILLRRSGLPNPYDEKEEKWYM